MVSNQKQARGQVTVDIHLMLRKTKGCHIMIQRVSSLSSVHVVSAILVVVDSVEGNVAHFVEFFWLLSMVLAWL